MFCPSPFFSQISIGDPEISSGEAMATTPTAKRAKTVAAASMLELEDMSSLTMKAHKDAKSTFYWVLLDGEVPRFNLTPVEPLKIIFGLDMVGAVERRSFNSSDVAVKPNESLAVRVNVGGELSSRLSSLDKRCEQLYAELLEGAPNGCRW